MSGSCILIVENEKIVAKNIRRSLESLGYSICAIVSSGPEAVDCVGETHPDLILMRLRLNKGMEGVEAAEQIRTRFGLPVVYLSDYTGDTIWQQAQPAEPFGYVLKPFEPRELQLVIEATLQQSGAARMVKENEQHHQQGFTSDNLLKEIIQRKKVEEQLRASEERFRRVISSISDHIYVTKVTTDGTLHNLYLSPHVEVLTGYPIENFMADWNFWPSTVIHPDDRAVAASQANQLIQGHNSEAEYRIIRADEQIIWVRDSGRTEREDDATIIYGVVSNITKRQHLEEQLRQSQKMEAVGRLAGGVAHDFNNLLTVIVGDCDLILNSNLERDNTLLEDVANIKAAGERAAALTHQLMAFSRKQILEPKVLDLNTIVGGVDNLLRRLIGNHIELITSLDLQLNPVKVDLHQLEQVIVNLAVNARDAMPKGGRLTIATNNATLDKSVNAQQLVESGNYVILTVSDTGVGMDAETQSHIFEPFFTTKKQGKGTGLGLATVYGIIQQSGGHINVTSAPDQGTTFTIYLPQAETNTETTIPEVIHSVQPITGSETILLVEDETGVRAIIRKFLQKGGYTVLEAYNSEEALNISQEYEGTIHLLVTDIMMPGLSGPELAERLISMRPAIKALYMSGYVDEAVAQQSLPPDAIILQKPFTPDILGRKVWEVLHSPTNENIGSTR